MRINPNPEVPSAGGFPVWAVGVYDLRIVSVEDAVTKSGKAQLVVKFNPDQEVRDAAGNVIEKPGQLRDYVLVDPVQTKTGGSISFLRALVEAAGIDWLTFSDSEQLVERTVKAKVGVDDQDRNEIVRYVKVKA